MKFSLHLITNITDTEERNCPNPLSVLHKRVAHSSPCRANIFPHHQRGSAAALALEQLKTQELPLEEFQLKFPFLHPCLVLSFRFFPTINIICRKRCFILEFPQCTMVLNTLILSSLFKLFNPNFSCRS